MQAQFARQRAEIPARVQETAAVALAETGVGAFVEGRAHGAEVDCRVVVCFVLLNTVKVDEIVDCGDTNDVMVHVAVHLNDACRNQRRKRKKATVNSFI